MATQVGITWATQLRSTLVGILHSLFIIIVIVVVIADDVVADDDDDEIVYRMFMYEQFIRPFSMSLVPACHPHFLHITNKHMNLLAHGKEAILGLFHTGLY